MRANNKRLTILTEEEKFALYELPDFDELQQHKYLILTDDEQKLVYSRSNLSAQLYCALQVGYFKAKHLFFDFDWNESSQEDIDFIMKYYFSDKVFTPAAITQYEYYDQVKKISSLFGYRLWSKDDSELLYEHIVTLSRRDVSLNFILPELLRFMQKEKIIRPGYTVLQDIISRAINAESERLGNIILNALTDDSKQLLEQLIAKDYILSYLSTLKQDSKNFGYKIMSTERQKLETIKPLYFLMKQILPKLDISRQNLFYYANLANSYTVYELRRLKINHSYLYLLCYCWQRYLQITDNLINSFGFHLKQFDDETKLTAMDGLAKHAKNQAGQSLTIGKLLQLFVDKSLSNDTTFGEIREKYVFPLIPEEKLLATSQQMVQKPITELSLKWKAIDSIGQKFKKHLRAIFMVLDYSSIEQNSPWLAAINELKKIFSSQKSLSKIANNEFFVDTIPKKLRQHLLFTDQDGEITGIQANRYEFWIYRQISKRLESGELYIDDSINHRYFEHELVSLANNEYLIEQLDLPCFQKSIETQLEELGQELKTEWKKFDNNLKKNALKHIQYDIKTKTVSFHKPKINKDEELIRQFYEKLPVVDNIDLIRFVNDETGFLSAFTPIQPRYTKQLTEDNNLIAVLIAHSMNYGRLKLSKISDISYNTMMYTYQQYLRKSTLQRANDIISNATSKLPIFDYYSYDLLHLYGSVDGQKLGVERPTTKARYSKKYFGKGKGVVSYTLLVNHIPLQNELIGAHEHESYYVFDIYYNNTTDIVPTTITGDMHSINKANFIILHWFNTEFRPRFANLEAQLKHLYCYDDIDNYKDYWIKPVSQINKNLIIDEWEQKIKQIILTLATKETTQSKIIKKLCTYKQSRTLKAIFEMDRLKRSIYTLKYLNDANLQKNVHRSQNRLESYHQLRAAISQVNGKKQLMGRTDLELEISNQAGRLIANAIIYYNSALLSKLLVKYREEDNQKALEMLLKVSPVAWQNIHLSGYFNFLDKKDPINLDEIVSEFILHNYKSAN